MKPKTAYLALSILGAFLPYLKFVPWVAEHGLNATLFVQELFVNRIQRLLRDGCNRRRGCADRFIRAESFPLGVRSWWLPLAGTLAVGVSLGLPLFLYRRELKLEASADSQ